MQCLRHLRLWRWRRNDVGQSLVRAVPLICVAMLALRITAVATHTALEPPWPRGNVERAQILKDLSRAPGQHLIIVRQGPINIDKEWVYNEPDIDAAKVVWARDMGEKDNRELLQYFQRRRFWLLEADQSPPRLSPYPAE